MVTLGVTVLYSVLFRGFLAIIPILISVLAGYALSVVLGIVNFSPMAAPPLFTLLTFYHPRFELMAILTILTTVLVVIAEHAGHLVVTANIVPRTCCAIQAWPAPLAVRQRRVNAAVGCFFVDAEHHLGENIGVME